MRPRRFLPSINLLLAFDAVVRHKSVTAAANELNLTQSTVSRLISSLEHQLGKELFIRKNKRLTPNAIALSYQSNIARALDTVMRASMGVIANPNGGSLSLAVLPTFATHWLGPKLGDFLKEHPGISLNMSTRIGKVDFSSEAFDAAIYFGRGDWVGVNHLKLFDEKITACASPDFISTHNLESLETLINLPKLQLESRPNVWADWFQAQGGQPTQTDGMLMDQFSMMIQAAISGLGIALLPDYLAQIEINQGRLVPILKQGVRVDDAYWLVWPKELDDDAPILSLRSWLEKQISPNKNNLKSR